jgi:hypothetical protein
MSPFDASDVLARVERMLASADQTHAMGQAPAGASPVMTRSRAFNWPPTEEDLADIHVFDTTEWQTSQFAGYLSLATPPQALSEPPAFAPSAEPEPPIEPLVLQLDEPQPQALFLEPLGDAPLALAKVDAPVALVAPPRLVIRGLERRPRIREYRLSERTRRSLAVAATAVCGIALTTLLEFRSVPPGSASLGDEPLRETASANPPPLSAINLDVGALPLVSARRLQSRSVGLGDAATWLPASTQSPAATPVNTAKPPQLAASPVRASDTRRVTLTRPAAPVQSTPSVRSRPSASSPVATLTRNNSDSISGDSTVRQDEPARDASRGSNSETRSTAALATPAATAAADVAASIEAPTLMAANVANVPPPVAAVTRPGEDERGIYQALRQYERAYERLDVNAARAVMPSLNTRALTRAFEGLKAQVLEFSHCRLAMETKEATAICGGSASYVPRVGRQAARTEQREWTFRLRKVDQDWQIARAEVR